MTRKLRFKKKKREEILLDLLKSLVDATIESFPLLSHRELWRGRIADEVKEILEDLWFCYSESLREAVRDEKKFAKKQVKRFLRSLR